MVDPDFVVTREQYFRLVDERIKRHIDSAISLGARLKHRWDKAEAAKGVCDLLQRNFVIEQMEELDDAEAYDILEEEKRLRTGK